jgi:hypothetical protein
MDDHPSYKSSEKKFDLEEIIEKITKGQLEFPMTQLERSLYEIATYTKEEVNNKFEIGNFSTLIDLRCNDPIQCRGYIKTYLYSKDKNKVAECNLDPLSYKIKCIDYSGRPFELSNSHKNISLIEDIKNRTLEAYIIKFPAVLTHRDKPYMHIIGGAFIYPDNPIKDNPEIFTEIDTPQRDKYFYVFVYNNGRFNTIMALHFDDPYEDNYF